MAVEATRETYMLNTDLDEIADAFLVWGQEQELDFLADSPYNGRSFEDIVVGAMLDISSVFAHEMGTKKRLDAEYYRPAFLQADSQMHQYPSIFLGDIAFITDGQHGYHEVDEDSDIKHITARCIANGRIDISQAERLAESTHLNNLRSSCEPDDVILSTAGTIGNTGIVTPDILPANMDQDVARIKVLEPERLNPWYLMAFLNSFYGRFQTTRETTGQIQGHLSLFKVRTLEIPLLPWPNQLEIAKLTQDSIASLQDSERLYREAEELLLDALGIKEMDLSQETSYGMGFTQAWHTNRLDAEYFHPEKLEILNQLEKMPGKTVSNYFEPVRDLLVPDREMTERVCNYDLTHALRYFLDDNVNLVPASELGSTKKRFKNGDIVVSRLRSYLKEVAVVYTSRDVSCVGSTEFFIFRTTGRVSVELLLVYLRSEPVQKILKWCQDGSNHPRFQEREILTLKLPDQILLVQEDINELIKQGIASYGKARNLLEEAKRKVEEMISVTK